MNQGSAALTVSDEPLRSEPRIVLVCDSNSAEFQAISFELLTIVPDALYRLVEDIEQLAEDLKSEEFPDLILFLQTWSDEHAFSKLLTLPFIGPFTRLLCIFGPWCGGDGRSRQDWPLSLRIPLEHFGHELRTFRAELMCRMVQEQGDSNADLAHPFLPWTAGRDEGFSARYHLPSLRYEIPFGVAPRGRIRINSPDVALSQVWRELFQTAGFQVSAGDHNSNDVLLWDADPIGGNLTATEIITSWNRLNTPLRFRKSCGDHRISKPG
jgi:hypothetical protein